MEYLIGIDLGGTNIVCGLLDSQGKLIGTLNRPTGDKDMDSVLNKITTMIDLLLTENKLEISSVYAVGMGVPGTLDPFNGICIGAVNLGWKNAPVAQNLQEKIGRPVFIDNDVRMYIYGEAMTGAGKNMNHVLGLTMGTGMAAAIVNHGEIYYGSGFLAGEIGHVPVDGINYPCNCGGVGCLETVASGSGIARSAREKIEAGEASILQDWYRDIAEITAADISHAYDQHDQVARQVLQTVAKHLARSLSYIIPLLSPEVIIIGGGVALTGERLLQPLREELQRLVRPMYWNRLTVISAQWIDEAGIIGSAMFARHQLNKV